MATQPSINQKVKAEVKQAQAQIRKGFNAKKYVGAVKWGQDAVAYQRELRDDT